MNHLTSGAVHNHLADFEEMGVVKSVERGDSTHYTLNTDNDLAHELYRLEGIALKNRHEN